MKVPAAAAAFLLTACVCAHAGPMPVPRASCFPVEDLAAAGDREYAEEIYLKILDSEGLFTIAGGHKPMSSGFVSFNREAAATEIPDVDRARRVLAKFHCGGELVATVHHFAKVYPNDKTKLLERPFEGVVLHRAALARAIERRKDFFAPAGVTPHTEPMEALMMVEYKIGPDRLEGLGILYGYPAHAVRFFADAARSQERTGKFVERRFVSLSTFARAERGVVYAVPKDHEENSEDAQFRATLESVLSDYRARRERYIGPGKPGVIALLRDWFCGASDRCAAPVPH